MVFKRRDRRPLWKIVAGFLWPKGGWGRAFHYIKHRVRRLPDPPHRIARGIFAGVFVTFSPFFGLHFFGAALVALLIRGNVVASILATFFGNPLTFVPIGVLSINTGYFLLGLRGPKDAELHQTLGHSFAEAWHNINANIWALFTDDRADWSNLSGFYEDIFFPYMIGGIIPGIVCGLICYYISLPLIQAYQNRRRGALKAKWAALKSLKEKAGPKADAGDERDYSDPDSKQ